MTKKSVKNYTLYKLRFWLGYGFLALLGVSVLLFAATYVPGGLTTAEQSSALRSASLNLADPSSFLIVDLPYHALQKTSLALLGLSSFTVKLPSLLIGFVTAVGLILVLRRRFSQTVSILAAGIVVVSAQFISLATTGTPHIMIVFWPVMLLLVASYGLKDRSLRPAAAYIGGIVAALSIWTPFSLYILLALAVGGILHPRIRYLFRKTSRSAMTVSGLLIAASIAVITYAAYRDMSVVSRLVYQSDSFSLDIVANLGLLAAQLVDFSSASTQQTGLLAPVFGLSVLALAGLGVYHLLRWRHSVLSYLVFSWTLLMLPVIAFNPTSLALLIVPVAFLVAAGSSHLLNYWYDLFPLNPYARIFALVPVTILFACVIMSGATRYFYAFHYYAPLANSASYDIELVEHEIASTRLATLLVSPDERPFYQLYLDANDIESVTLEDSLGAVSTRGVLTTDVIATRHSALPSSGITPSRIVATSRLHSDSDRLYVYTKPRQATADN